MSHENAKDLADILDSAGIAHPAVSFGRKPRDPDLWVEIHDSHPKLRVRGVQRTNIHFRQLLRELDVWATFENEVPVLVTKANDKEPWIAHLQMDDLAVLVALARGD